MPGVPDPLRLPVLHPSCPCCALFWTEYAQYLGYGLLPSSISAAATLNLLLN